MRWLIMALLFWCWVVGWWYITSANSAEYQYEYSLDSQKVVFHEAPGVKICGRWYRDNQPASVPNGDWPQSSYCRTTDANGTTFFVYWNPNLVDISQYNITFIRSTP